MHWFKPSGPIPRAACRLQRVLGVGFVANPSAMNGKICLPSIETFRVERPANPLHHLHVFRRPGFCESRQKVGVPGDALLLRMDA